jgi:hypothetical protein
VIGAHNASAPDRERQSTKLARMVGGFPHRAGRGSIGGRHRWR